MMPLGPTDFPIYHIGPNVYRMTESSPFCVMQSAMAAADLVFRLNRDEAARNPVSSSSGAWIAFSRPGESHRS